MKNFSTITAGISVKDVICNRLCRITKRREGDNLQLVILLCTSNAELSTAGLLFTESGTSFGCKYRGPNKFRQFHFLSLLYFVRKSHVLQYPAWVNQVKSNLHFSKWTDSLRITLWTSIKSSSYCCNRQYQMRINGLICGSSSKSKYFYGLTPPCESRFYRICLFFNSLKTMPWLPVLSCPLQLFTEY